MRAAAPRQPVDAAFTDWQFLFAVVRERLRGLACSPAHARDLQQVQAQVLDCVGALDKLHALPALELERCRTLASALSQAQAALAQTRTDLAGSLAGASQAHHLARHDGLTQLANRGFFRQQLEQSMAARGAAGTARLALVYLDIDGFKPINDAHGHGIGDEVLRIVALRLARAVRGDDLVARLGGDEFACLLNNAPGRPQLALMAAKLGQAVREPLTIGTLQLAVSVSIGIATAPLHGNSADALLTNADLAMYHAKRRRIGHAFADDVQAASAAAHA